MRVFCSIFNTACADNCQYCESPYTCVPNGCKSGYSYVYNVSVNYCVGKLHQLIVQHLILM